MSHLPSIFHWDTTWYHAGTELPRPRHHFPVPVMVASVRAKPPSPVPSLNQTRQRKTGRLDGMRFYDFIDGSMTTFEIELFYALAPQHILRHTDKLLATHPTNVCRELAQTIKRSRRKDVSAFRRRDQFQDIPEMPTLSPGAVSPLQISVAVPISSESSPRTPQSTCKDTSTQAIPTVDVTPLCSVPPLLVSTPMSTPDLPVVKPRPAPASTPAVPVSPPPPPSPPPPSLCDTPMVMPGLPVLKPVMETPALVPLLDLAEPKSAPAPAPAPAAPVPVSDPAPAGEPVRRPEEEGPTGGEDYIAAAQALTSMFCSEPAIFQVEP